jgi:hypothetical protein
VTKPVKLFKEATTRQGATDTPDLPYSLSAR